MSKYKIIVLGETGVGKSNFIVRFVRKVFVVEYDPTVDDCFRKQFLFDDKPCVLYILDTVDDYEYSTLNDHIIRSRDGFILAYDITSTASYETCDQYVERILRVREDEKVPMILIGTKSDLEDQRTISFHEGAEKARVLGIPFLETSAKLNINVEEAFYKLVEFIKDLNFEPRNKQNKKTGKCQLL